MKITRFRAITVYIVSIAFILGLVFFLVSVFVNGNVWATNAINNHLSESGSLSMAGKILDRNGEVLAQTVNGQRTYNTNKNVRTALLHTVGDDTKFISTALQNSYRADLIGYNFITGLTTAGVLGVGNDITSTVDSSLCSEAYSLFAGRKGAAMVYNYVTGEVLCMCSTPSYDPENPPDYEDVEGNDNYEGVYLNKCLSSALTPGSIFKIVTCAAAIENIPDIYERKFYCKGEMDVGSGKVTCMENHGEISFKEAMSQSCNIVFAQLALEIGRDKMTEQAEKMGFNESFNMDSIFLAKSIYDVKNESDYELAWSGVGQSKDLVNPAHMLMIMGAIANDGVAVEPYAVEKITSPLKYQTYTGYPKAERRFLSVETANKLKEIMRYTVNTNYGDNLFPGLTVCAKTGTAEVGENTKPNGWMVGFSTDEDCPLAFAVVVENSSYGYTTAGPIAEALMQSAANIVRAKS